MDKKITLTLTVDQLNVVMAGLSELPAKTSFGMIQHIQTEASRQLNPAQEGTLAEEVTQ